MPHIKPSEIVIPDDVTTGTVVHQDDKYQYMIKRFGDLQVGDEVPSPGDEWQKVAQAYAEHMPDSMYEIEANGTTMRVSGNHLFYVETDLDRQMHANRVKSAAKTLQKHLSAEGVAKFWEIATDDSGYEIEMLLSDIVNLARAKGNTAVESILARVAESIGPISEISIVHEDLETGVQGKSGMVCGYDGKRFTQQVLSLRGERKARRQWPVIVGRVVTTIEMLELMEDFNVHIPNPS